MLLCNKAADLTLVSLQRARERDRQLRTSAGGADRQTAGRVLPGAGTAPEHTAEMGVEIETITPGDGKAAARTGNVFVLITKCTFALIYFHVSNTAAETPP